MVTIKVWLWRLFRNLTDIYTIIYVQSHIIVQISVISGEGIVLAIVTGTPLTRPVFSVYDSDPDAPGTTQAVSSHPGQVKISVGHCCLFLIVDCTHFCS